MSETTSPPGRPRNPDIDTAVIAAVLRQLAVGGFDALSVASVADEAGTTRQAIYRRWSSKADLATAAISSLSRREERADTEDSFADLVAELDAFHEGVTRPNGVSMAASMLLDATDAEVKRLYRERVVAPRRTRLRHILATAAERGLVSETADLDYLAASATGTLYAFALAGHEIGADWPLRTAQMIWRAAGGDPADSAR